MTFDTVNCAIAKAYASINESVEKPCRNVNEAEWKIEKPICEFDGWSGAEETIEKAVEAGKKDELEELFSETFYGSVPTEEEVNDWLRFESDSILERLGIGEDGDDEDEDEEIDEDEDADDVCADGDCGETEVEESDDKDGGKKKSKKEELIDRLMNLVAKEHGKDCGLWLALDDIKDKFSL